MRLKRTIAIAMVLLASVACFPDTPAQPGPTTTTPPPTTVVVPSTTVAPTTVAPTTTVPSTGKFSIVGNKILDPSGKTFIPMGANVAARVGRFEKGYVFNVNGTATDHVQDVKNWGWNIVRTNNICVPPADPGLAATQAGISALIDEYTAQKVVVMVDCHDVTGQNPTTSSPGVTAAIAMQDYLANKYKDNTYVWFNVLNEPQNDSNVANWLSVQKLVLSRLRAIAPDNIYVADLPRYGQAIETVLDGTATALGVGQKNVLYSWHAYGAVGDYGNNDYANEAISRPRHKAALDAIKAGDDAVVIGEFGDPLTLNEGTAGQPIWNRIGANAVMDYAPADGVGLMWWHATGDSGVFITYSLTADRSAPWNSALTGTELSAAGRKFWTITH